MSKKFYNCRWPNTKDELHVDLKPYWSYRVKLVVIDGIILKGRCIVIPNSLRQQVLRLLHTNLMSIEKTKLLAHESVYWSTINADIEDYIENCTTCLEFQQMQPKERIIHHGIPMRLWEVIGADVFHFNNKNYLCVKDYNCTFPVIKRLEGVSAESLINTLKITCYKCSLIIAHNNKPNSQLIYLVLLSYKAQYYYTVVVEALSNRFSIPTSKEYICKKCDKDLLGEIISMNSVASHVRLTSNKPQQKCIHCKTEPTDKFLTFDKTKCG